jgi:hypothetical protein
VITVRLKPDTTYVVKSCFCELAMIARDLGVWGQAGRFFDCRSRRRPSQSRMPTIPETRTMPPIIPKAFAISVFSGQQNGQSHQCDPASEPAKHDPRGSRLRPDELAQHQSSGHKVRELAQRLNEHGTSPRLQS